MRLTATDIAQLTGGAVDGAETRAVTTAAPVHQADPQTLTYAADEANLRRLRDCSAAIAIVAAEQLAAARSANSEMTFVYVTTDVEDAFLMAALSLHPQREQPQTGVSPAADIAPTATIGGETNIHPNATVSAEAEIGCRCTIYPGAYIGRGVVLGNDVVVHPNVVIYDDVTVGDSCIIHANAVIGADGFGYRPVNGRHVRIPHLGTVRLGNDVEIGAGSTIDRAKIGETVIGDGTKIDNLVMIGHNCELGRHNLLASQVGFAGSVSTGDYVVCAGQVGIADHVHLGDGAIFGAKCGVHRDMPGQATYLGSPASPIGETRKQLMAIRKLPDLRKTVRDLERQLTDLKASLEANADTSSQISESRAA